MSVARVGYEGVHCEINVNECALQPPLCQNNGGCEDNPVRGNVTNWFVCRCGSWGDLFFTGTYCETTFGQCDLELLKVTDDPVCHNGGTCRDFPDYFQCDCAPGWEGTTVLVYETFHANTYLFSTL